jgi:hypothetical protein
VLIFGKPGAVLDLLLHLVVGDEAGVSCVFSDDVDISGRYAAGARKRELERRVGFIGPSLGSRPVKMMECFLKGRVLRERWQHSGGIDIQSSIEVELITIN